MNIIDICEKLINIDSPSGFGNEIRSFLTKFAIENDLNYEITNKGNVNITLKVDGLEPNRVVATHVDTLGLMVSKIDTDGKILVCPIGSPIASTLNGEYAKLYTRDGDVYSGTLLIDSNSKHVFADSEKKVEFDDMYFRIDYNYDSKCDIEKLGIEVGDYICYDSKFKVSGDYINSHFLDNKLCAAIALDTILKIKNGVVKLDKSTTFSFTMYEEVGHGLSYVDQNVSEIIALDMACVGNGLSGSECKVTICAKDSSGPYDYNWVTKLRDDCNELNIDYAIDVYPFYGSDASAAMRGGNDIKACLIGPGISASHGMERSHIAGVENTQRLLIAQLQKEKMIKQMMLFAISVVIIVICTFIIANQINVNIVSQEDKQFLQENGYAPTEDYNSDSESFANKVNGLRITLDDESILVYDPEGVVIEAENFVFTPRLHIFPDSFKYGFDIMPYSSSDVFDYQIMSNKLIINEDEYNFSKKKISKHIQSFVLLTVDLLNHEFTTLPTSDEYEREQKELDLDCDSCMRLDDPPVKTIGEFDVLNDDEHSLVYRRDNAIFLVGDDEVIIELINPNDKKYIGSLHVTEEFKKYSIESKTENVTQNLTYEGELEDIRFLDEDGQKYVKSVQKQLDQNLELYINQFG